MDVAFVAPRYVGGQLDRSVRRACPLEVFVYKLMLSEDVRGFAVVRAFPCGGSVEDQTYKEVPLTEVSRRFYLYWWAVGSLVCPDEVAADKAGTTHLPETPPLTVTPPTTDFKRFDHQ